MAASVPTPRILRDLRSRPRQPHFSQRAGVGFVRIRSWRLCLVKSSQDSSPQMTRKPNTQNRAQLMCLSGQPALKVRLAARSNVSLRSTGTQGAPCRKKQAGRERMGVCLLQQPWLCGTSACEVAGGAAQNARAVPKARFVALECYTCAALAEVKSAQPPLRTNSNSNSS